MNNQFADNLKKIRKEKNLSQEQLADELGVSRQAISKWESGAAYPEMDKIIFLCNKFNLNIDDLLHKDIKEVKKEEESKKKINKYVDDFLKFITDTVNLFSNMTFKSKMKCIFEQGIIITILLIISIIGYSFLDNVFDGLLSILPVKINYYLGNILESILFLLFALMSLIILIHIFKTRYLDYFSKIKEETEIVNNNTLSKQDNKNKIAFRQNEKKIIIRDPKHSEYRFINGLFKFIIGIIKFFALWGVLFLCGLLVLCMIEIVLSFLVVKTKAFFIGLFLAGISLSVIDIILILLTLNFIFNRTNNKKWMIISFISALLLFGASCGLIFIGSLDFDIVNDNSINRKVEYQEIQMHNNQFFHDIEIENYIEEDIDNIRIEYSVNEYCTAEIHNYKQGIFIYGYCDNPIKLVKEGLKDLNNKKIMNINNDVTDIKIYASKENIEKLKNNQRVYFEEQKQIDEYQNIIEEKNEIIRQYEIEIAELESKIKED